MPDVLGLDLGLANVGAASITERGAVATWVHRSKAGSGDVDDMIRRIAAAARFAVGKATTGTILAVVEGPSYASQHGSPHERGAVYWRTLAGLRAHEIPVVVMPPQTLKRWTTGKGTATKGDMQRAVTDLWPGQGLHRVTPDEVDALALAGMGAHAHRWHGPWLRQDHTVLDVVTWPATTITTPPACDPPMHAMSSPFTINASSTL